MSRSVSDVLSGPHRGESIRVTVSVTGDHEDIRNAIEDAGGSVHKTDRFGQLDATVPETEVRALHNRDDVYTLNAEGDIELATEGN